VLRTHWATVTNFKDSEHTSYPDVADLSWHEQRVLGSASLGDHKRRATISDSFCENYENVESL
jgi:hypothetical protein